MRLFFWFNRCLIKNGEKQAVLNKNTIGLIPILKIQNKIIIAILNLLFFSPRANKATPKHKPDIIVNCGVIKDENKIESTINIASTYPYVFSNGIFTN